MLAIHLLNINYTSKIGLEEEGCAAADVQSER